MWRSQGKALRMVASSNGAPSRSCMSARCTMAASIVATRAGCLGGLHRLAVDNAGGRARLAPLQLPRLHHQSMVDASPGAIVPPTVEAVLNRSEWRKLPWQHPLMAAALCDIEDRIQHVAHRGLPLAVLVRMVAEAAAQ